MQFGFCFLSGPLSWPTLDDMSHAHFNCSVSEPVGSCDTRTALLRSPQPFLEPDQHKTATKRIQDGSRETRNKPAMLRDSGPVIADKQFKASLNRSHQIVHCCLQHNWAIKWMNWLHRRWELDNKKCKYIYKKNYYFCNFSSFNTIELVSDEVLLIAIHVL